MNAELIVPQPIPPVLQRAIDALYRIEDATCRAGLDCLDDIWVVREALTGEGA